MSEKTTIVALGAALSLLATTALADGHGSKESGFGYLSVGAGVSVLDDFQATPVNNVGIPAALEFEQEIGFQVLAAAGYAFRLNPDFLARLELEYGFRESEIENFIVNGNNVNGNGAFDGAWNIHTVMVNGVAEYEAGRLRPYLGVGVGVAIIDPDNIFYQGGGQINFEETETVFAAQGMVGVNYALTDRLDLFSDLRYLATSNGEFLRNRPSTNQATPHEGDFNAFSANAGLRVRF